MPIGKIEFFNLPISRARGERPLVSNNWEGYKVGTANRVKMTFEPSQTRTFKLDEWDDQRIVTGANVAMFTYTDQHEGWSQSVTLPFWINSLTQSTMDESTYTFDFEFLPIPLFQEGAALGGMWERTPVRTDLYTHEPIMNDVMAFSEKIRFNLDPDGGMGEITRTKDGKTETFGLCWVQITSTVKDCPLISSEANGPYDLTNVDQSCYNVYGFPCLYYKDTLNLCRERLVLPEKGVNDSDMAWDITNPITGVTTHYDYSYLLHSGLNRSYKPDPAYWMDLGNGLLLGSNITGDFLNYGRIYSWAYVMATQLHTLPISAGDHPCLPSLDDVINNPDSVLGIPAASITDISVSTRCPYEVEMFIRNYTDAYGYTWSGFPVLMPKGYSDLPTNGAYGDYDEFLYEKRAYTKIGSQSSDPNAKYIASATPGWLIRYTLVDSPGQEITREAAKWKEYAIYIEDEKHDVGQLSIKDEGGNSMAELPVEYFNYDAQLTTPMFYLHYKWKCWNDTAGIYTTVVMLDENSNEISEPILLNEGKLPYVGDAWTEYKMYDMANDRTEVNNAKWRAAAGFLIGGAEAAVTGSFTSAMGRVGAASKRTENLRNVAANTAFGGTLLSQSIGTAMDILAADQDQALKEKRMRESPGQGYNPSYGYSYLAMSVHEGAGIYIEMPANFSQEKYTKYHEEFGFPADGYSEVEFQAGFWKGRLVTAANTVVASSIWFDRMIEEFANGVHMISIPAVNP